jgi:phenylpropionate dioxygenase-like ring-hydroxylating dioxygenase large terminal subunit
MGAVLRNYWVPAFRSADLPMTDSDPIRVRVFAENFVAFRGSDGGIGFLDEGCPHRGASLVFAQQEDCALRCLYHGWKIAADGTILEAPNAEHAALPSGFHARSYPVEESHGLVWVYLGPEGQVPPRPRYVWETLPAENTLVIDVHFDCNWVQVLEGLLDSSHAGILHADVLRKFPPSMKADGSAMTRSRQPRIEADRTDFGIHYGAVREGGGTAEDLDQVRITAWAAPFVCFIPPDGLVFVPIPMDDGHTKFFNIWWDAQVRLDSGPAHEQRREMWGLTEDLLATTGTAPVEPPRGEIPARNRWPQDRDAMRKGQSFSGLNGVTSEDGAMAVGMGPIVDRSKEHLVAADRTITMVRRILLREARAVAAGAPATDWHGGKTPYEQITALSGDLAPADNWRALVPAHVAD